MIRSIALAVTVVLVALVAMERLGSGLLGSPPSVSLSELYADPGHWDNRFVTVTGRVGDRVSVLGYGGLKLSDDSGNEILVIGATSPSAPGKEMKISGKFLTAFTLGNLTVPVILATAN